MRTFTSILILGGVLLLTSCSSAPTVYPGEHRYADGWRQATVLGLRAELWWFQRASCGKSRSDGEQYMVLQHRVQNRLKQKFIPIKPSEAPAIGSSALVNIETCEWVRPQAVPR